MGATFGRNPLPKKWFSKKKKYTPLCKQFILRFIKDSKYQYIIVLQPMFIISWLVIVWQNIEIAREIIFRKL